MLTVVQKLRLIQRLSGLTQEKLARKLAVSFVAFNSWINARSIPRKQAQERIDDLYREHTGEKIIPENILKAKKQIIFTKTKKHKNMLKIILNNLEIYDQFILALTYHTNKIEGSTLSEAETADVLFRNIALPNKDLIEQMEAKNHQTALQYLLKNLTRSKKIDENLILKLHAILMNGIRQDAGLYRRHGVRIVGANMPTANYLKVPVLMTALIQDIDLRKKDVVSHISEIHSSFEKIHPFSDGNGRIGRLIIQAMALRKNLPPVIIRQEKKRFYYAYLNRSQKTGDMSLLEDFICDAVLEGFEMLKS